MSEADDPRERVIRQATFYARAFATAAIIIALAGSALVARFLLGHMPFLVAWLLVLGTIGTSVLLIFGARALLERNRGGSGNHGDADGPTDTQGGR